MNLSLRLPIITAAAAPWWPHSQSSKAVRPLLRADLQAQVRHNSNAQHASRRHLTTLLHRWSFSTNITDGPYAGTVRYLSASTAGMSIALPCAQRGTSTMAMRNPHLPDDVSCGCGFVSISLCDQACGMSISITRFMGPGTAQTLRGQRPQLFARAWCWNIVKSLGFAAA
jgi:hypothetical protein